MLASAETEWPILLQHWVAFTAELQWICAPPCRCHAGFCILHGRFSNSCNSFKNEVLVARPERFELPTPRFVVWCCRLLICIVEICEALERVLAPPVIGGDSRDERRMVRR